VDRVVKDNLVHSTKSARLLQVPEADLRAALDALVRDNLRPVSAGLVALFLVLAVGHKLLSPKAVAPTLILLTSVSAALLLGFRLLLSRWSVPLRWAHPLGAAIAGVVLLNGLLHLYLASEPAYTTGLLLLIVGAGFFLLSTRWLVVVITATLIGWGMVASLLPMSPEWLYFGFMLSIATILATVVHTARVQTMRRLEGFKIQNELWPSEVEAAFASTEEARRALDTNITIGRALTGTLELAKVLDLVLEHLAKIVPFDRGSVMLASGDEMEMVAARGFPATAQPLQIRISLLGDDNDIYRHIYLTQQSLSIPDVSKRRDWQYVEGLPPACSWLGVPLIRSDVVIGQLSLTRETPHPFSADEVTLATTFAGQAAIALENARLYDNLSRAYEQLERMDRTKSDFIAIVSHELRTPVTVLRASGQMLLNDPVIKENPFHQELVSGVYSGTLRLQEIVDSMLDMVKIDSRALQLDPKPLSIPMLIRTICSGLNKALAERRLNLKMEDMTGLPAVEADLDALNKVFNHLIFNAIKYTPDGGTITISGRSLTGNQEGSPDDGIEIVVSDTGIGIDPHLQELIFEKFYQTGEVALHSTSKTKFKGGGPGLGLTIARGIVQAHGGKLWVESPGYDEETCPGSQFHVVLPLRQRIQRQPNTPR
jgi:signal transduction histidine kinase